ncbi:rsbT co-antagonist protein RsbR [Fictibacillus solisalsi]|uniref:RsbT co-antagonist protein RsbR n=1 Tax=Fictibacillus solisalsi TaxID=459525 RepID=A0A1G9YPA1_9BACL|nr:STAS domain-containing protein [Fictibacillus solisalsi]SDN10914.1 rsbT co-antagonist protein RsbR [Fictibacillus solisalsi]
MVIEKQLYMYLLDHSHQMADEWMNGRDEQQNSRYSIHAPKEVEDKLRMQHIQFTDGLAHFIHCEYDLIKWAKELALEREHEGVPLLRIIQNFKRCREICWQFIEEFARIHEQVEAGHISSWSFKLNSAFDIIIEVFVDHYHYADQEKINQRHLIAQLGVPIIPINEQIGVLPLIGDIDSVRMNVIQEQTLTKALSLELTYLIIDLSGVYTLDTTVAEELFTVIEQLSLVGIKAIITGIRPEIAMTSIQLGLDFSKIIKFGTLQMALAHLFDVKKKVRI